MVDTSSGFFRNAIAVLELFRVFFVDQCSKVTTIVEDQIEVFPILECRELLF